ncbi:MAG: peptidoglycan-binding protein [Clostridiales bacterium]|nr:peptidoglycan-binding protein [Clostridiales bacterium]
MEKLQTLLNQNGAEPPLVVDGIFGSETRKAVNAYKKEKGLAADGIAGTQTWDALLSRTANRSAGELG